MVETTIEKVTAIAQHLSGLENSTIELYIEDAQDELKSTPLEDNERAQRYLAAHFGTLNVRRANKEEISNEIRITYDSNSENGLQSTKYGQEFLRIQKNECGPKFKLFS